MSNRWESDTTFCYGGSQKSTCPIFVGCDAHIAPQVESLESRIDHFEDRIGSYVIQITNRNMLENDSAKMSVILHSINDLERISDHAVNLKESAQEMQEKTYV